MATRDEIKKIMAYMIMSFPNYHPVLDGEVNAIDVMTDLLGDLDTTSLQVAVKACCTQAGRAFAPSAGEIRGMIGELLAQANGIPDAATAWGAIMESFHVVRSQRPVLLSHPLVADAIHCMGGLEAIGMSDNPMVERAHFLKIYEQLRAREMRETIQLPVVTQFVESKRLVDNGVNDLVKKLASGKEN
jgi:hypothetical protein